MARDDKLAPNIKDILDEYIMSGSRISMADIRTVHDYIQRNDILQRGYNLPIYRGLAFSDGRVLSTMKNGVLALSRKPYESWTKNAALARGILMSRHDFKFGIILQRDINRDDIIVDLDHISDQLTGYLYEKEILTTPFCHQCPISAIKLFMVRKPYLQKFKEAIEQQGWRVDISPPMLRQPQQVFEFTPHIQAKRLQRRT